MHKRSAAVQRTKKNQMSDAKKDPQQQQQLQQTASEDPLDQAVQIVRQMGAESRDLKEQCLRTEWAALQTDLERDLLLKVVADKQFWDEIKEVADEDMLDSADAADDDVDVDQRMLQMFKCFDKDGSNSIDALELHQMLLYMGIQLTDGEVREMIASVDADQDGGISSSEFLHVMKVLLPAKQQAAASGLSVASAKSNMDAQREIRATNVERDALTARTHDAAAVSA